MTPITTYQALLAAVITAITGAINTIKTNIATLPRVAPSVRSSLNGIANERLPFVERSVNNHIVNYPALMPPGFNAGMVTGHWQLYQQMENLKSLLADINETVDDAQLLTGDQLFNFISKLNEFSAINIDVNTAGAQVVHDDLQDLFSRTANSGGNTPAGGGGTPT